MSRNPIDKILDENDSEPIVLYNEKGEEVTFEQVAVIPLEDRGYTILKPIGAFDLEENEALVFELVQMDGDMALQLVLEDDINDAVFADYTRLLEEEGSN